MLYILSIHKFLYREWIERVGDIARMISSCSIDSHGLHNYSGRNRGRGRGDEKIFSKIIPAVGVLSFQGARCLHHSAQWFSAHFQYSGILAKGKKPKRKICSCVSYENRTKCPHICNIVGISQKGKTAKKILFMLSEDGSWRFIFLHCGLCQLFSQPLVLCFQLLDLFLLLLEFSL